MKNVEQEKIDIDAELGLSDIANSDDTTSIQTITIKSNKGKNNNKNSKNNQNYQSVNQVAKINTIDIELKDNSIYEELDNIQNNRNRDTSNYMDLNETSYSSNMSNYNNKTNNNNNISNKQFNSELDLDDYINDCDIEKDTAVIANNEDTNYSSTKTKKSWCLGNTYAFCWVNNNPLFVIGPHWPFFICLNSIIMSISITYFYFLWDILYVTARNIGFGIFLFQNLCYWHTALINPGVVLQSLNEREKKKINSNDNIEHNVTSTSIYLEQTNMNNISSRERRKREIASRAINSNTGLNNNISIRICVTCNIEIDVDHTSHCEDCNVCIEDMDHHCPWTGKCIEIGRAHV